MKPRETGRLQKIVFPIVLFGGRGQKDCFIYQYGCKKRVWFQKYVSKNGLHSPRRIFLETENFLSFEA